MSWSQWQWLPPTVLSAGTFAVSVAVYRLNRRQNRDVKWTVELGKAHAGENVLTLVNRGINRARHVEVTVSPTPTRGEESAHFGPEDVDLGGKVAVSWPVLAAAVRPERVEVTWRRRFGRIGHWSTRL